MLRPIFRDDRRSICLVGRVSHRKEKKSAAHLPHAGASAVVVLRLVRIGAATAINGQAMAIRSRRCARRQLEDVHSLCVAGYAQQ